MTGGSGQTVIGSTRAGRIAVCLPVFLIAPLSILGFAVAAAGDAPVGLRVGFLLILGLPLGALCVWMIRSALGADALTISVSAERLQVHIDDSTLTYERASTDQLLLRVGRAGVYAISVAQEGEEPIYLATGWRWRRPASVQKILARFGWPSAITSNYFGDRQWHPVLPEPPPSSKAPR